MSLEVKSEYHVDQLKSIFLLRFPAASTFFPKLSTAVSSLEEVNVNDDES